MYVTDATWVYNLKANNNFDMSYNEDQTLD